MGNTKNNKLPSTIWLDFLTYIFMPFYIFTLSLNMIDSFNNLTIINIIKSLIYVIIITFNFITFYYLIKRKKNAYYCMIAFYIISMITIILDIINKYSITKIIYIIELVVAGIICWIIPNYIYLKRRKLLFKDHQLLNIKKCPGCNRIIPISMNSCGRCNYKE